MRITIDEQTRQVHASQGDMLMTVQLARTLPLGDLEAAADGLRSALENACAVVVNGEAVEL